ncbi:hypothetical protein [Paenibacillus vini]|uniref:HEPN domain-containing protein n=1 Tax=Paenibacillus vini TaxID=1476024 RepID=A0ABQ4MB72_9BACL|nr:hypothetical protein [Paenibacillus vini]GIP53241.1 hypothetical protein J42TS3_22760 [Paenibacillus vini]
MKQIKGIVDSTAIAYFLSYKCLIDKHIEVCDFYSDFYSAYFVPAITTAAFSCELALKNIIEKEIGKSKSGHDLNKLFSQLKQDTQRIIIDRTVSAYNLKSKILKVTSVISESDFINLLLNHKDTFAIWRYFYEKDKLSSLDLDFLEAFLFSVNGVQEDYKDYVIHQLNLRNLKS